jgi:hypothetical protein
LLLLLLRASVASPRGGNYDTVDQSVPALPVFLLLETKSMRRRITLMSAALAAVLVASGWLWYKVVGAGADMTAAAEKFLASLSDEQRKTALLTYDNPVRLDWHFIPKAERKGLQIKEMSAEQRKAAHALLAAALSQAGYQKATTIMELEAILHELEKAKKGGNIRDTERYYFTVFGQPTLEGRWGLSVEGHHLSLNFVVSEGRVVSSTPAFFGANPAEVKSSVGVGPKPGTRVLRAEEQLAFDLVNSLDDAQRKIALIAGKAPDDIRGPAGQQPPGDAPQGLSASKLNDAQKKTLRALLEAYCANMPKEVADRRMEGVEKAGLDASYFAWAGATKPGVGHYYRVQGPSYLIEFVNVQPDAAGNIANHIHCVWRDMAGDFALPRK